MSGYAPYIFALAALILFACLPASKSGRGENAKLVIIVGMLTLISGLRATTVGSDTATYSRMFYWIASSPNLVSAFDVSTINAPVYVTYAWVLGKLGFSHQMLLLANAAITNIGICLFIKRTSCKPAVSFLLYFCLAMFFESMNGMRQYFAIAFAINAYLSFYRHGVRSLQAWVLMAVAVGVHSTAVFLAPGIALACVMRKSKRSRRSLSIAFIAALVLGLVLAPLADVFVQLFPNYSMYDGSSNIDVFAGNYQGRIRILYAVMLVFCLLGFFSLTHGESGCKADESEGLDVVYALFPLCSIVAVMGLIYGASFLINRLLWFYMVAFISFIPAVVARYRGDLNMLIRLGSIAAIGVWTFAQFMANQDDVIPYMLGSGLFG